MMDQTLSKPRNVEQLEAKAGCSAPPCSLLPEPFYERDGITIYHGDCRLILPLLGTFDLLMADPPYGIDVAKTGKVGGNNKGVARDYGASEWDKEVVEEWVMSLARSRCRKQIIFGGNYYALPPCKGPLIWDKQNTGNFADGEMAWNNLGCALRIKRHLWNGMIRKGDESRDHPTQKPLEVIQWAIMQAGDVETILDPWAGSGTTGHAAKNLGKRAVLIEREERYCEIAVARLAQDVLPLHTENATAQTPPDSGTKDHE
jgi:DNA modification methylase